MLSPEDIIKRLPYGQDFLFAEKIITVSEEEISGLCYFPADHPSYRGHFLDKQVLPGIIVIEGMGQIGLVAHSVFLSGGDRTLLPVLHQITAEFHQIVPVNSSLLVKGELVYFRNNTIKTKMSLFNEQEELIVTATALAKLINKEQV